MRDTFRDAADRIAGLSETAGSYRMRWYNERVMTTGGRPSIDIDTVALGDGYCVRSGFRPAGDKWSAYVTVSTPAGEFSAESPAYRQPHRAARAALADVAAAMLAAADAAEADAAPAEAPSGPETAARMAPRMIPLDRSDYAQVCRMGHAWRYLPDMERRAWFRADRAHMAEIGVARWDAACHGPRTGADRIKITDDAVFRGLLARYAAMVADAAEAASGPETAGDAGRIADVADAEAAAWNIHGTRETGLAIGTPIQFADDPARRVFPVVGFAAAYDAGVVVKLDDGGPVPMTVRPENATPAPQAGRAAGRAVDLDTDPGALAKIMEFGHVIRVNADGTVSDAPEIYAPEIYVDTDADGQILDEHEMAMVRDVSAQGWTFMDGYSGQYCYSGPIMHSTEFIGGAMARDILSDPGVYVAVSVECIDDPEHPAGWAALRRVTDGDDTPADDDRVTAAILRDLGMHGAADAVDTSPRDTVPAVISTDDTHEHTLSALPDGAMVCGSCSEIFPAPEAPSGPETADDGPARTDTPPLVYAARIVTVAADGSKGTCDDDRTFPDMAEVERHARVRAESIPDAVTAEVWLCTGPDDFPTYRMRSVPFGGTGSTVPDADENARRHRAERVSTTYAQQGIAADVARAAGDERAQRAATRRRVILRKVVLPVLDGTRPAGGPSDPLAPGVLDTPAEIMAAVRDIAHGDALAEDAARDAEIPGCVRPGALVTFPAVGGIDTTVMITGVQRGRFPRVSYVFADGYAAGESGDLPHFRPATVAEIRRYVCTVGGWLAEVGAEIHLRALAATGGTYAGRFRAMWDAAVGAGALSADDGCGVSLVIPAPLVTFLTSGDNRVERGHRSRDVAEVWAGREYRRDGGVAVTVTRRTMGALVWLAAQSRAFAGESAVASVLAEDFRDVITTARRALFGEYLPGIPATF